ncbi:FadR/GntR family transcriptional regulator [Ideonella sp. YS5]|uniref:FadR/GntR family transcriptional regulator n=1 Tax=Ideonella sp. YS5 TaxID=3453714 RepID=UPI003EEEF443
MPNAKQAEPRRLYHQVADQIRVVIEQGGFGPGTRLPPERELALQLGVSRPSLREALLALEIQGRVEIRMGSGVYVCAAPTASTSEPIALGDSPSELMQARSVFEGSVINLALARVTKAGLDRVKSFLETMRQDVRRGQSSVEADRGFHVAIAEMTGNSVLVRIVGELYDGRHGLISSRMTDRAESARTWAAALREHEAIYQALEARDPQEAVAAMFWHLTASRERWTDEG